MIDLIWKNILKRGRFDKLEYLLSDFEDFEEFPLTSRCSDMDSFVGKILDEDRSYFLMTTAIFILQNLYMRARMQLSKAEQCDFLAAITLIDGMEYFEEFGYIYPHIFVTRKASQYNFIQKGTEVNLTQEWLMNREFRDLEIFHGYACYRDTSHFEDVSIDRLLFVPNQYWIDLANNRAVVLAKP